MQSVAVKHRVWSRSPSSLCLPEPSQRAAPRGRQFTILVICARREEAHGHHRALCCQLRRAAVAEFVAVLRVRHCYGHRQVARYHWGLMMKIHRYQGLEFGEDWFSGWNLEVAVVGVTAGGGGEGCITMILAAENGSVAAGTTVEDSAVWFSHYSFVTSRVLVIASRD
ncbi:uncharacterized protein LOC110270348 [Arachis ipaensis]|uniref:uncharacterized protein LOC110270348 n=1 Tax=Arachis ipaensis TaxID=130454 RepID=UPI000A2B1C22|nr:uncharacterized protein LOC110270348 [Arachis ipaensis]